jgi:hypothetical protein
MLLNLGGGKCYFVHPNETWVTVVVELLDLLDFTGLT